MEKAPNGRILLSTEEVRNLLDELFEQQAIHGVFRDSGVFPTEYIGEGNTKERPNVKYTFYRHYSGRLRGRTLSFEGLP